MRPVRSPSTAPRSSSAIRAFVLSGLEAMLLCVARLDLNGGSAGDKASDGVVVEATADGPDGDAVPRQMSRTGGVRGDLADRRVCIHQSSAVACRKRIRDILRAPLGGIQGLAQNRLGRAAAVGAGGGDGMCQGDVKLIQHPRKPSRALRAVVQLGKIIWRR